MGFSAYQPRSSEDDPANSRRTGRVRVEMIRCSLGDLLDVSASGLRAEVRGKPPAEGARLTITISGLVNSVEVTGRIVWVRRTGWRRSQVGVSFEEVGPEARSELAAIARAAPLNPSLHRKAG